MLAPLDSSGVLPPTPGREPYRSDVTEVEERFVTAFADQIWRRVLFDQWDLLRLSVAAIAPTARWWLWGSLLTSRSMPLFGETLAVTEAAVFIPESELPDAPHLGLLLASAQTAEGMHRVRVHDVVFEVPATHPGRLAVDLATEKLRSRASRNIVDDSTKELIDAGFVEVSS